MLEYTNTMAVLYDQYRLTTSDIHCICTSKREHRYYFQSPLIIMCIIPRARTDIISAPTCSDCCIGGQSLPPLCSICLLPSPEMISAPPPTPRTSPLSCIQESAVRELGNDSTRLETFRRTACPAPRKPGSTSRPGYSPRPCTASEGYYPRGNKTALSR